MKLVSLACQNCSAPLEVPEGASFVTCRHCDAQLAIKHTSSAAYTEVLQDIDKRTQRIESRLKNLERGSTLSDIDREWEQELKKFMIAGKDGQKHLPTVGGSIIGGLAVVAFGIFWTIMAFNMTRGAGGSGGAGGFLNMFPLFGVLFVLFGAGMSIYSYTKARDYLRAEQDYRRRRAAAQRGAASEQDSDIDADDIEADDIEADDIR